MSLEPCLRAPPSHAISPHGLGRKYLRQTGSTVRKTAPSPSIAGGRAASALGGQTERLAIRTFEASG